MKVSFSPGRGTPVSNRLLERVQGPGGQKGGPDESFWGGDRDGNFCSAEVFSGHSRNLSIPNYAL